MEAIKSFTSLNQSEKLAEFLPLESADMWYVNGEGEPLSGYWNEASHDYDDIHCWSLAALLNVLPNGIVMNKDSQNGMYHFSSKYIGTSVTADNPVDACVTMIEKLHELNLL